MEHLITQKNTYLKVTDIIKYYRKRDLYIKPDEFMAALKEKKYLLEEQEHNISALLNQTKDYDLIRVSISFLNGDILLRKSYRVMLTFKYIYFPIDTFSNIYIIPEWHFT